MKKTLAAAVTLAALGAGSLSAQTAGNFLAPLAVKAQVGTESEYIYRGKEHSDLNIQTRVVLEYSLPVTGFGASIYGAVFSMEPVTEAANQLDGTVGGKIYYEDLIFDLSYTFHSFPNKNSVTHNYTPGGWIGGPTGGYQDSITNRADYNRSNEIAFGVSYEAEWGIKPSGRIYYDFNLEQVTFEGAIAKTFETPSIPGAALTVEAYAGYVRADAANGDQRAPGMAKWRNDYGYVGFSADVSYRLNDFSTVGTGIRYAWNSDGDGTDDIRLSGNTEDNLWWGVWINFSY